MPSALLDAEARLCIGISGALGAILTAQDGLMSKLIASRMVEKTLSADGPDLARMMKTILEYTEGTPVHREPVRDAESDNVRVIEIVQRSSGYETVDAEVVDG